MAKGSKTARRRRRGRQAERVPRKVRRRNWLFIAYGAFAVALVGIMIFFLAARPASPEPATPIPTGRYSQPGDHWHATYTISICGSPVPKFPDATRGIAIHTHGDGLIHVEPQTFGEAGANANLARFMDSTGGKLTEDTLQLPNGQQYTNGDPCPDGRPGQWVLRVNGQVVTPIASYAPQDGEKIELSFEPG